MKTLMLALLLVPALATPLAADLPVRVGIDDPETKWRRVYLHSTWTLEGEGSELVSVQVYLPKGDVPAEQTWDLLYADAEVLRQVVQVCRHNPNGSKVSVRGREVVTLLPPGRGVVVEAVRTDWK